jgi:hypothetical protein
MQSPTASPPPAAPPPQATGQAPTGAPPQAPASRSLTRADVIALASKGKPWDFLPVAVRALEVAPDDAWMVLLTAANLGTAGLATLGKELHGLFPAELKAHPEVAKLSAILDGLPSDIISVDQRVAMALRNIAALATNDPATAKLLLGEIDRWRVHTAQVEHYRALDGNIVRRPAGTRGIKSCLSLSDQLRQSTEFVAGVVPPTELMGRPIVVEGLSPPWIFRSLFEASSQSFNGYRRRLIVVQADPLEFLDGLAVADLTAELADTRVSFHVGPGAAKSLAESMAARLDTGLIGQYIPVLATRNKLNPATDRILHAMEDEQKREHVELLERIDAIYASRDAAWWAARYASGLPLKVLIPTSRFSTFIRFASRDLAEAFEVSGHSAKLIMEPDEFSSFSSVGYLREIAEFQPDLVVLINYPRSTMGASFPSNIPFVCWVQDAMPHLFDPKLGAAQGPLDFLAGVKLVELTERFGYPSTRAMPMPVVVSRAKFEAPVRREALEKVEIVFATNHGETPDEMHARLSREAAKDPLAQRALDALRPVAERIGRDILQGGQKQLIRSEIARIIREIGGGDAEQRALSTLTHAYVLPMADRIVRHQTASWAASIARRRGWNFRLCGKNWEHHPTLSEFAAAPIDHDTQLRDSYNTATVHLHASYHGAFHQRVFECALAGGLPLCRLVWPTVSPYIPAAIRMLRARLGNNLASAAAKAEGQTAYFAIKDHPELREFVEFLGSQRMPELPGWRLNDLYAIPLTAPPIGDTDEHAHEFIAPLMDVQFRDEAELEGLIERAATDPAWRADRSEAMASVVRSHFTHELMAERLVGFIGSRLGRLPEGPEGPKSSPCRAIHYPRA